MGEGGRKYATEDPRTYRDPPRQVLKKKDTPMIGEAGAQPKGGGGTFSPPTLPLLLLMLCHIGGCGKRGRSGVRACCDVLLGSL